MNFYQIWNNTVDRYRNHQPKGTTTKYIFDPEPVLQRKYQTKIEVKSCDMFNAALELPGCLLLNMANESTPGGYPERTGAQEEDLFRRSNLYKYLTPDFYPIKDHTVLISDKVEVFSGGLNERYAAYSKPIYIDVVSCPGIKNSNIGTHLYPRDAQRLQIKLHTLFQAAHAFGYKDLILSALGCGGFRCPPEHVSVIFKQILKLYDGCFDQVWFCITNENYPKCNYQIFKQTFE